MKESEAEEDPEGEYRGIDSLMHRYSRWKIKRLTRAADEPLTALTLRTLYLSACILLDGVFLPWIVMILEGGFSLLLFSVLLVPTVVVEWTVYRRMTPPQEAPA